MIKGTFTDASGCPVHVIIDGDNLFFCDSDNRFTTIEGLKMDKSGTLKEFPDLIEDDEWKLKAIQRLKEHIKNFKTEMEKLNYVRLELEKSGYKSLFYQKAGFRPSKFKNE
jgi:hypothetical protein